MHEGAMATLHTKGCAFMQWRTIAFVPFVTAVALLLSSPNALAQSDDAVGVRAQGMAGAFTAVADDASATWWNPAGLGAWNSSGSAGGTFINLILDLQDVRAPATERAPDGTLVPAWRVGTGGVSVGSPALGLSYYRLRISEIQPISSIAGPGGVRQDQGIAEVYLRSLVLNQFGATVGQSLGEHLVVGSTLKLVYGGLGASTRPVSGGSLDQASDLETRGEVHAGLDVGAMAMAGELRAGLTIRNVTEPGFGSGPDEVVLKRHARGGLAWLSGVHGPFRTVTVSADADLTAQATALGDERRAAAGVEVSTRDGRLAARTGVGASTLGSRRTSVSAGLSVAIRRGSYIDAAATAGADQTRRGWGLALRVTF
jgi:F plasmid transfer operon protein TraF